MSTIAATTGTSDNKNRALIIAAVVFAAICAILLFVALQSRSGGGSDGTAAAAEVPVIVAAVDISSNTVITEEMLAVESVPTGQLLADAYGSTDVVVGLPARYLVQRGEQLTAAKVGLQAIQDEKDLALVLQPGQRGFAVEVREVTAVGGLLLPGNFVDIIAVNEDTAVLVMQNVEVVSVAQAAQEPVPAAAAPEGGEGAPAGGSTSQRPEDLERQPSARSVTLALTPQQAVQLALIQESGAAVWLALRPVDDHDPVDFPGLSFLEIFPLPPAPPQ